MGRKILKFDAKAEVKRALKRIKRERDYLECIFRSIHLAAVVVNKNGKITDINQAAEGMWGLSLKENLGDSIDDLPFFARQLKEKAQDTLLTRNKNELPEWSYTHPSGEERFLKMDFVPLIDEQNEIEGVILIGTDITMNKQLQKEKKILEGLLPICSHCKKIRDKDQDWVILEQYIDDHSSAKFSHGICPDCVDKYYPDV
jgi:PAS domain S-box-containing protein